MNDVDGCLNHMIDQEKGGFSLYFLHSSINIFYFYAENFIILIDVLFIPQSFVSMFILNFT